ncbi:MAG TPA: transglycosylase SLT domain-containing protein [Streptosporangiaceae bacterium]|nr:transglycosylase SLT domain-containing protein [Streptosporangiaceae bacterium]
MATYSYAQLEGLWIQAGGSKSLAPLMAAIALAESSGNPGAHNASGASGLWQILGAPTGWTGSTDWYNPQVNARAAVAKYREQGLAAWEAYTNGAYKQYLKGGVTATVPGGTPGKQIHIPGTPVSVGASGLLGNLLSLPSQVTDFLTALERPVQGLMWFVNPANWARIIAGLFGFFLLGAALITLGLAAL